MSTQFARIVESTFTFTDVAATSSMDPPIYLNKGDKFSIQVTATTGASIAHLEGSNNGVDWTEIDTFSIAEGESDMFEQPDCSYLYARITLENDDMVDVSADCLSLVIGSSM